MFYQKHTKQTETKETKTKNKQTGKKAKTKQRKQSPKGANRSSCKKIPHIWSRRIKQATLQ